MEVKHEAQFVLSSKAREKLSQLFPSVKEEDIFRYRRGKVAKVEPDLPFASYGVKGSRKGIHRSGLYKKGSGLSPEAKAVGVISKAHETVIKVDKASTGIRDRSHLFEAGLYIARNGKILAEDQDGQILDREALKDRLYCWAKDQDMPSNTEVGGHGRRRAADARRVVISFPPGTDVEKIKNTSRQFAKEVFGDAGYEYAFVLHCRNQENPDEPDHPHIHFLVKTINAQGERLYIRKGDLKLWRERLATIARLHGIAMNATARSVRGKTERSKPIERFHQERRYKQAYKDGKKVKKHPYQASRDERVLNAVNTGEKLSESPVLRRARNTRQKIQDTADAAIDELSKGSTKIEKTLAAGLRRHVDNMSPVYSADERKLHNMKSHIASLKRKAAEKLKEKASSDFKNNGSEKQSNAQKYAINRKKKERERNLQKSKGVTH